MNPTNKVQTRVSAEEAATAYGLYKSDGRDLALFKQGFETGRDSVILPEGKRFEVGDRAIGPQGHGGTIDGKIVWVPLNTAGNLVDDPTLVRPLPQAVELTDVDKLKGVFEAFQAKDPVPEASAWAIIAQMLVGKTLDQLCAEYNVPTTREVP